MARLIEVQDVRSCASPLVVQVGDVLLLHAAGGRVQPGESFVELLGHFVQAIAGEQGRVLTPQGPPNVTLFRACQAGLALIDVITGDPFHGSTTFQLRIKIES